MSEHQRQQNDAETEELAKITFPVHDQQERTLQHLVQIAPCKLHRVIMKTGSHYDQNSADRLVLLTQALPNFIAESEHLARITQQSREKRHIIAVQFTRILLRKSLQKLQDDGKVSMGDYPRCTLLQHTQKAYQEDEKAKKKDQLANNIFNRGNQHFNQLIVTLNLDTPTAYLDRVIRNGKLDDRSIDEYTQTLVSKLKALEERTDRDTKDDTRTKEMEAFENILIQNHVDSSQAGVQISARTTLDPKLFALGKDKNPETHKHLGLDMDLLTILTSPNFIYLRFRKNDVEFERNAPAVEIVMKETIIKYGVRDYFRAEMEHRSGRFGDWSSLNVMMDETFDGTVWIITAKVAVQLLCVRLSAGYGQWTAKALQRALNSRTPKFFDKLPNEAANCSRLLSLAYQMINLEKQYEEDIKLSAWLCPIPAPPNHLQLQSRTEAFQTTFMHLWAYYQERGPVLESALLQSTAVSPLKNQSAPPKKLAMLCDYIEKLTVVYLAYGKQEDRSTTSTASTSGTFEQVS
jgi:hypothetical protein